MDEREVKKLKAEIKRLQRNAKHWEKEALFTDRVVEMLKTSIEAIPCIEAPKLPTFGRGAKHNETALLLLSDAHIGKRTRTYRPSVFVKRLRNLETSMMSIINAIRSVRPVKRLVIAWGGDLIDAESIYPSQAVDNIAIPVLDQIFTVGVPELSKFLLFCLSNFEVVDNYCVRGNHGRQVGRAKWSASKSTNWDFVLYKALGATTAGQDRMSWNIEDKDWKSMFRISGEGFLLTHGAQIRRYYNLPFVVERK